jgi:hypothetical protein
MIECGEIIAHGSALHGGDIGADFPFEGHLRLRCGRPA